MNEIIQKYKYKCDNCGKEESLRKVNFVKTLTLKTTINLDDDDDHTPALHNGLDELLETIKEYTRREMEKQLVDREGESILCNICFEDV